MNRNRVFQALYHAKKQLTKQELATQLSMSLPTLTQNLTELMAMGLVENSGMADSSCGRRPRVLSIVPQSRWALGVEISSHHVRLVALDLLVNEISFQVFNLPFSVSEEYSLRISQILECFIDERHLNRSTLLGVGISVPGTVNHAQHSIHYAPTLVNGSLDFRVIMEHIPYAVHFANDANAGGFAELWGRTGTEHMAYLSVSRGIGGAILTSGAAYLGSSGRSGEFGHMCIHPEGIPCRCGRRGCLEAYCSTALLSDNLGITMEDFFHSLDEGKPDYLPLWNRYLDDLSIGIANIHAALDSEIVLGGKLSRFLVDHFSGLDERLRQRDPAYRESPYLTLCRYYDHSSCIGAALYFLFQFIREI